MCIYACLPVCMCTFMHLYELCAQKPFSDCKHMCVCCMSMKTSGPTQGCLQSLKTPLGVISYSSGAHGSLQRCLCVSWVPLGEVEGPKAPGVAAPVEESGEHGGHNLLSMNFHPPLSFLREMKAFVCVCGGRSLFPAESGAQTKSPPDTCLDPQGRH